METVKENAREKDYRHLVRGPFRPLVKVLSVEGVLLKSTLRVLEEIRDLMREQGSIHVIKPSERDLKIGESPREFELTLEAPEGIHLRRMVFRGRPHSRIGRFLSRFITFEGIVTWEEEPWEGGLR